MLFYKKTRQVTSAFPIQKPGSATASSRCQHIVIHLEMYRFTVRLSSFKDDVSCLSLVSLLNCSNTASVSRSNLEPLFQLIGLKKLNLTVSSDVSNLSTKKKFEFISVHKRHCKLGPKYCLNCGENNVKVSQTILKSLQVLN